MPRQNVGLSLATIESDHATAQKLAKAAIALANFFGDRCAQMLPSFDLVAGDFTSALRLGHELLATSPGLPSRQARDKGKTAIAILRASV